MRPLAIAMQKLSFTKRPFAQNLAEKDENNHKKQKSTL
jgi:hypothetical protein